jgi:amino acid transporter
VVAAKAGTAQPWLAQAAADLAAQSGAVVDVVSAVNIGVIILRRTRPDLERGYRVPFVPVVPIIGTLLCIYLMVDLPGATWARFVIWMAIGLVIYFLYGSRNSRLRRGEVTNPEAELPGSP